MLEVIQMIRLKCDNLDEFIAGRRTFYTVKYGHPHEQGDTVILYNDYHERQFEILLIQFQNVLALKVIG